MAHGIGGRTVEELRRNMLYEEFVWWVAYHEIEPFGEVRADWRSALQTAYLVNVQRGRKTPIPVDRFVLRFQERRAQSVEEMEMVLEAMVAARGGEDRRVKSGE